MQNISIRKRTASPAPAPACIALATALLVSALLLHADILPALGTLALQGAPSDGKTLRNLLAYPLCHRSLAHAIASVLGVLGVGRSVELMVGGAHFIAALLLGTTLGALTHLGSSLSAITPPEGSLEGALPLLGTLLGMYSTILPGWRIGAASRWMNIPLSARVAGWLGALLCGVWWLLTWFPQGGPLPTLAGLLTGWAYARILGFGDRLFLQQTLLETETLEKRIQGMDWEEFLIKELNPVLEKISKQGLRSLSRNERRILRHSRRKLEGW